MINWIIGGVAVLVLAVGGFFVAQTGNGTEDAMMEKEKAAMEKEAMMQAEKAAMAEKEVMEKEEMAKDAVKKEDGSMMEKDEGAMMDKPDGAMMVKAGSYEVYAPDKLSKAELGDVVLFFRAAWCPTCKALDADIKAHLKNIPASLTILDVNYDSSAALKQKYGVTYQHTFVQVDAEGNVITKWQGSPTLAAVVAQVK